MIMKLRSGKVYDVTTSRCSQRVARVSRWRSRRARLRQVRRSKRREEVCNKIRLQVASCLNVQDLKRFKIKETPTSTAQWMREWATKSLARRFVPEVVPSGSSHTRPVGLNRQPDVFVRFTDVQVDFERKLRPVELALYPRWQQWVLRNFSSAECSSLWTLVDLFPFDPDSHPGTPLLDRANHAVQIWRHHCWCGLCEPEPEWWSESRRNLAKLKRFWSVSYIKAHADRTPRDLCACWYFAEPGQLNFGCKLCYEWARRRCEEASRP